MPRDDRRLRSVPVPPPPIEAQRAALRRVMAELVDTWTPAPDRSTMTSRQQRFSRLVEGLSHGGAHEGARPRPRPEPPSPPAVTYRPTLAGYLRDQRDHPSGVR